MDCTEIASNSEYGFKDNGHYIGHDEPATEFFSNKAGSGGSQSYQVKLPVEPSSKPNGSFTGPVWTFQNNVTFWFGMVLCDNESYPEGTKVCTPNSDANIQVPPGPGHAGAAFLELQFYPPGMEGFGSCDKTHWCAALTIDSRQAQFGALHGPGSPPNAIANPNCPEPVNFAYLTKSGTPIGPPGPDTQTNQSFNPTNAVLRMNQSDVITVNINDTAAGLSAAVTDHSTGQGGSMVASVANGFRHILFDPVNLTCNGAPYAFHPMYNTAAAPLANGQPTAWTTWAAHTFNISESGEVGHFEPVNADGDDNFCVKGPAGPRLHRHRHRLRRRGANNSVLADAWSRSPWVKAFPAGQRQPSGRPLACPALPRGAACPRMHRSQRPPPQRDNAAPGAGHRSLSGPISRAVGGGPRSHPLHGLDGVEDTRARHDAPSPDSSAPRDCRHRGHRARDPVRHGPATGGNARRKLPPRNTEQLTQALIRQPGIFGRIRCPLSLATRAAYDLACAAEIWESARPAGICQRRHVALRDQALSAGGVQGGVVRCGGSQPVDVPVEHAKHCGDQDNSPPR